MKNHHKRSLSMIMALVLLVNLLSGLALPVYADTYPADEAADSIAETGAVVIDETEPAVVETEPAAGETEPVTEVTEPSIDVTEPAAFESEPVAHVTEPAVEITEPIIEETTSGTEDVVYTDDITESIEAAASIAEEETEAVAYAEYSYNTGIRGETCTELSTAAEAFYTGKYTYDNLSVLSGAASRDDVPESALYEALQTLMASRHTHETSYGETRYQYQYTDCQDGGNWENGKISSFYSGAAIGPDWDSGATWNREHTWPNSKGLGGNDENDIMMLRPTSKSENSSRSNKAYGKSSGYYNPNSESGGAYDVRGDVARIFLYIYVRWGNVNGNGKYTTWGTSGVMESEAVLLEWMEADPVDTWELGRNDVVQEITGTRNVFVDYPELAFLLFNEEIPDSMPTPSGEGQVSSEPVVTVEGNSATGGGILTWEDDPRADYYEIYRKTSSKGKYKSYKTVTEAYAEVNVTVGKTYYYKVKAICKTDPSRNSGYSNVVKVTGKCAQPVVVVNAKASSGKPYVDWEKVSGAEKYDVYRAKSEAGPFTKVKTTTSTAYTDSKAELGVTYYYRVKAIASKSTYNSAYSEVKSCLTILAQPKVTLKTVSSTGKPVVTWGAVSGATGYQILRAESETGAFTELVSKQTELSYTDSSAGPDKDYWYKVNAIGATADQNSIDADAKMIHSALAKPSVTFGVNSITGRAVLSWEKVDGAKEYKIYRSTKSTSSYKSIGSTEELSFTDKTASVGKGYYYKVIAIGENSKSAYSSYKKLTAKCAQPEIDVTAKPSSGKPYVDWDKVSGAEKYYVYRATEESGTYKKVKTTTSTSYTDKSAKVGVEYFYKVKAIASKSTYNSIESEVESCLTVLAQPEVELSVNKTTGKPVIEWEKISGAVSYELYRSENGGEFELISTQTELTYTDENTVVDGAYSYKVKAIAENSALNSAESVEASVFCACEKPSISIELDGKKPMVSWESVEGATKYYVYRSTKKSSGYKKVATVEPEDGTSYRDSKAKKGTTYYYKVVAVSENAKSAYSNVVKIKSK